MSKAHKGKKHSAQTIAKISAARRERQDLIDAGLLEPFRHSKQTKAYLRKLALKQKRKPGRKALKNSISSRSDLSKTRKEVTAINKALRQSR